MGTVTLVCFDMESQTDRMWSRGLQQEVTALADPLHSHLLHRSEKQWAEEVLPLIQVRGRPQGRGGVSEHEGHAGR